MAKKILKAEDFRAFMIDRIAADKMEFTKASLKPDSPLDISLHTKVSEILYNFIRDCWDEFTTMKPTAPARTMGTGSGENTPNGSTI